MSESAPRSRTVVLLLLGTARRRATGRIRRQVQLRSARGQGRWPARPWLSLLLGCLFGAIVHLVTAATLITMVAAAERVQAERDGRVVVEEWFAGRIEQAEAAATRNPARRAAISRAENADIAVEAGRLAARFTRDQKAVEARLRTTVSERPGALVSLRSLWWRPGVLTEIVALLVLLWWAAMLVCQGETQGLDVHRPRYPLWEWLFSHPVKPAAVFLAEMITPITANPVFLTVPLLPGLAYGNAYGTGGGIAAAVLIGVPLAVALACLSKAVEMWVVLRLPPRSRGALLGAMSAFSLVGFFALCMTAQAVNPVVDALCRWLAPTLTFPWPPTRRLLGLTAGGNYVFWLGLVTCWAGIGIVIAGSIALAADAARFGLLGKTNSPSVVVPRVRTATAFGQEPLYRKELLWFRRDRAALVQAILLPLSLGALQTFNLRTMLPDVMGSWNQFCGAAILFGTYFLLTLGPKSLASEGPALWLAQTWPLGLEGLMKAKAKFWTVLACALVGVAFLFAAWRFPAHLAGIAAVAVLWGVFARSLADKAVTLATVTSSSGEPERLPGWMRWTSLLGILSFSIGVITAQWSLAIAGVVYSIVTAAAMWQVFRHRLPFLFDPWSATLPPPPTMLHAMCGIGAMVEGVALFSALALATVGRDDIAVINAALYALFAVATALVLGIVLARRGVPPRDVWLWRESGPSRASDAAPRPFFTLDARGKVRTTLLVAGAAALGAGLGVAAHGYIAALRWLPETARMLDEAQRHMNALPHARLAYLVMAVGFAPLAEEFLFRGLLYRALDKEWKSWQAVLGAGAFFAIYHPVLSWLPVAALGVMNAILFKRTGRLATAVAAHMAYNAVLLMI